MIKEMIEENHMYDCNDCKQDVGLDYWYMLYRIVWNAVCPENGMLCVPCLTKRLKRPLKLEDFNMDLLCNHTTDSVIKRHGIKI